MAQKTVTIIYINYAGKQFEKRFTGTDEEINEELDRMRSLPDVKDAYLK